MESRVVVVVSAGRHFWRSRRKVFVILPLVKKAIKNFLPPRLPRRFFVHSSFPRIQASQYLLTNRLLRLTTTLMIETVVIAEQFITVCWSYGTKVELSWKKKKRKVKQKILVLHQKITLRRIRTKINKYCVTQQELMDRINHRQNQRKLPQGRKKNQSIRKLLEKNSW